MLDKTSILLKADCLKRKYCCFRTFVCLCLFQLLNLSAFSQYYIRGEVKDESGKKLPGVTIVVHSSDRIYYSGQEGRFGIVSNRLTDSLTFSMNGYNTLTRPVNANEFQEVILKAQPSNPHVKKNYLKSFTINNQNEQETNWTVGEETYSNLIESDFVKTTKAPTAIFSANINRASYSNIRRFLTIESRVPPDAVRIEEMLNYFNFSYNEPPADKTFAVKSYLSSCPWNNKHRLLFLNISARKVNMDKVPPSNLVFLIDVSGSMVLPNKLPLLKSGFRLLVNNLRNIDTISIVTYGGAVNVLMEGVSGEEKEKIFKAIEQLTPQGPTPGEAGVKMAYQVAKRRFIKNGNNRIILTSDGDFNVGKSSEKELEDLIEQQRQAGIYLTCLGVGMGNYKDSKLSVMAGKGQGNFAYLDKEEEAEKVLVTELTQTLFAVADNVAISVKFDSALVQDYRIIGFDNTRTAIKDTSSKLQGGVIGSGHSLMAIFELTADKKEAFRNKELAEVKIHYYLPSDSIKREVTYQCLNNFIPIEQADSSLMKAAHVAMFGMKLRNSKSVASIKWKKLDILSQKYFSQTIPYEKEYTELVDRAAKMYGKKKRKRRD
jgi:Ca-activated chloride channel family protein